MINNTSNSTLLLAVLNQGVATHFCREAANIKDTGHTTFLGYGTAKQKLLQFFCLDEVKKEIVLLIVPSELEDEFFSMAIEKYKLNENNTGIMLGIDVKRFFGTSEMEIQAKPEEVQVSHKAIFTIVEKNKAEDVMEVAEKAGARGGTIIHARGAGIHEHEVLFNLQVEPEKEILMIVTETENALAITKAIREEFHIDEPGNGILFVLDVDRQAGMVKNKK